MANDTEKDKLIALIKTQQSNLVPKVETVSEQLRSDQNALLDAVAKSNRKKKSGK